MKYSVKLSDTIHLLVFAHVFGSEALSSSKIAESIKTNPAYVRQLMSALKKAEIISNSQGLANISLCREPKEITLLDIYRAVEGDKPLLHFDADTNPECGVGITIQFAIADIYKEIQDEIDAKMRSMTLQDVIDRYNRGGDLPLALKID